MGPGLTLHRRPNFVREPFDIEEVLWGDVVRGDVAAPSSTPKRHRRVESGGQPDRPVSRRRVHADPERWLLQPKLQDHVVILRVDGHRVAHAAIAEDLDAAFTPFAPVLDDVPGKNGTQLFDREWKVAADA